MNVGLICRRTAASFVLMNILVHPVVAQAAAFQLWEQDAASIGNFHAGYAAAAEDASTSFYNPAGLTRFNHQQLVLAGDSVFTNFKYNGTVAVSTLLDTSPQGVVAQGGGYGFIPALHYVAPLTEVLAFGFSTSVPFGLMTNYGDQTILRYAATQTSITTVDVSPTLALKLGCKTSIGFGPDIQYAKGEFDSVGVFLTNEYFGDGVNKATDTGYGYHGGVLYEFTPNTRAGLSYHSKVRHHLTGTSTFEGPLVDLSGIGPIKSNTAHVNVTLPAYTALSVYHQMSQFAVMASTIFTQWNSVRELILHDVAGIDTTGTPSTNITVTIPQYFRNTWNMSVGANYYASEMVTLRGGLGFDQTPVTNTYRNVQMPDNNRYVVAFGSHFQTTKTIGLDISWMHLFVPQSRINPPPQVAGNEITTTSGKVNGGADVLGAQITWNLT